MHDDYTVADLGWCVIHSDDFIALMERAHRGEDPDMLYAEFYANTDHERVEGDCE